MTPATCDHCGCYISDGRLCNACANPLASGRAVAERRCRSCGRVTKRLVSGLCPECQYTEFRYRRAGAAR